MKTQDFVIHVSAWKDGKKRRKTRTLTVKRFESVLEAVNVLGESEVLRMIQKRYDLECTVLARCSFIDDLKDDGYIV